MLKTALCKATMSFQIGSDRGQRHHTVKQHRQLGRRVAIFDRLPRNGTEQNDRPAGDGHGSQPALPFAV
ncbi:hypothetical protein QHJ03_003921 [Salmonella enterica]|uniref:hypothetical protein n=1 Tax=Salmonella enterica TaxID=28901 RepID=UPI001118E893|nr:hypothetical protein [Salmonella enterica]EBM9478515.1 hypothetical protein [Salmonella enterica subsp. enterica serovar Rubislaw]EHC8528258.1 hypothetical protein [Salmonella enterica subsp. enterica serovar 11:r:-]EBO3245428.1 hypothetical protein [Salmonella enterica subsp. enterica serovar Rubislaw]EBT5148871.1 hypothetical protein [Salmonella enterica]EBU0328370.1 hypothetical protein [Salmonella enterica]